MINKAMTQRIILASAIACATTATAQTPPPKGQDSDELQEIVVTGSLLRRTDIQTISPVQIISADDIKNAGFTSMEEVIHSISADNSGSLPTAFGNAFAAGASGVALRGLTVNSTLVLIDGRRAAPYAVGDDGIRNFVDLNTIPIETVERVEVLKDGASSLYGADAIGGVVNVILKKSFQGAQLSAEVGRAQHPGGGEKRLTGSAGAGDLSTDKYNAYISFEFEGDDRILTADRPFPFNTSNLTSIGGDDFRFGTPGTFQGTTTAIVAPATLPAGVNAGNTSANNLLLSTVQAGAFQPIAGKCGAGTSAASAPSAILGLTDNYCLQNRNLYDDDQPAQQRIGVSTRFTVQLNDNTQAYLNATYYQSNVWVDDPPAVINNATPVNINNIALPPTLANGALNPNDPFAAQGEYAQIYYAFGDIPNSASFKNHNARLVGGLKGTIGTWDYDTALVVNHTWLDSTYNGQVTAAGIFSAVENGTYNFVNPAANSSAAISAISPTNRILSTSDEDLIDFRVTHDILTLQGGPLGVALGTEMRYEAQLQPQLNPNNAYEGLGVATASGTRNVEAAYAEFDAPIIKQFELDVSGRYDHYSDFGQTFNPKAGFKFTPIKELAFRGTFSKGFRAPGFPENGQSESGGFVNITPSTSFPAYFCAPTYHSAAYCQQYSQLNVSTGNPGIQPEHSKSYTFGVIFNPLQQFNLAVDYYYIQKTNLISVPNYSLPLNAYLNGQPIPAGYTVVGDVPDPAFPNSLPRPVTVEGAYVNANSLATDGVDLEVGSKWDLGAYGHLKSELSVTKIFSWKIDFPGQPSQQYVGTESPYNLSSGAGTPRYKGSWSNTYAFGPNTFSLDIYYVSGIIAEGIDLGLVPCIYAPFCRVASFTYGTITDSFKVNDHLTVSGAIENVLDRLPPLNAANYAGVNYNPTYDQAGIVGRYFKLGAAYKF